MVEKRWLAVVIMTWALGLAVGLDLGPLSFSCWNEFFYDCKC